MSDLIIRIRNVDPSQFPTSSLVEMNIFETANETGSLLTEVNKFQGTNLQQPPITLLVKWLAELTL